MIMAALPIGQIMQADCLHAMSGLPADSIDMVLSDLPYGNTSCRWDTTIPLESLWAQYKRIAKPNAAIVLTATQPFSSRLVMSNLEMFRYEWIWKKNQPCGFFLAKQQPMRNHEHVLVFYLNRCIYNPQFEKYADTTTDRFLKGQKFVRNQGSGSIYGKHSPSRTPLDFKRGRFPFSVLSVKSVHNSKRLHPTQKPIDLFEYLIRTYTNEGDIVLDNCFGSGTTGLAAIKANRRFVGIEKDPKFCEIAKQRIDKELRQRNRTGPPINLENATTDGRLFGEPA